MQRLVGSGTALAEKFAKPAAEKSFRNAFPPAVLNESWGVIATRLTARAGLVSSDVLMKSEVKATLSFGCEAKTAPELPDPVKTALPMDSVAVNKFVPACPGSGLSRVMLMVIVPLRGWIS